MWKSRVGGVGFRAPGFTLVELLVVLTIVAVLATLAGPSFGRLLQSNAVSGGVNTFLADMRYARSEGSRLGGGVILCRSDNPEAAEPVCALGASSKGWATGWIVFHDLNGDGDRQADEALLRNQEALKSLDEVKGAGTFRFRFGATGRLVDAGGDAALRFGNGDTQRVVCVNRSGRARVAGDSSANCEADT